MEEERKYVYRWDYKLKLCNLQFGEKINNTQYNLDVAKNVPFPSDYLLAVFSTLAYSNHFNNLPQDWELLTTAINSNRLNGYFGVAFWNSQLCQIVVAHRGTTFNTGAWISDVQLASNCETTNQAESAATFVYLIAQQIKQNISKEGVRYSLSITGHSLGAWLAQMSTFTLKYFEKSSNLFVEDKEYASNIHAHTVVFECPGCRENLAHLSKYFIPTYVRRKFGNFHTLDMTVYLSAINPINSINKQVGTVYMIQSKTHSLKDILQQFDQRTEKIEREVVLDFKSGLLASIKSFFKRNPNKLVSKTVANDDEFSLNVFDENELDFIKDWIYVKNFHSDSIQKFENLLPPFKVDYEYNLIKGNNIYRIIAVIKNLRPSKSFTVDLLESVFGIKQNYEIFKMISFQFVESLTQYSDEYFFKDKYRLKEFLAAEEDVLLNICINSNLINNYKVETSILNNVCQYYKNTDPELKYFREDRYGIINWSRLSTVLRLKPQLFNNSDVDLLIIECDCELDDGDSEEIKRLLVEATSKIIILSIGNFILNTDECTTISVDGFGHNAVFQDLLQSSQEKLLTQKSVMWNGRKYSIGDLLNEELPFGEKSYEHLNQALPTNLLLQLLEQSATECLNIDISYKNILTGITIEVHEEIDLTANNLKHNEQSIFLIQSNENETSITEKLPIEIAKCTDFEKECLNNLDKTVYLISETNNKVFLSSIFRLDLYITKKLVHSRTVNPSIFENLNTTGFQAGSDQFFICGSKEEFTDYFKTLECGTFFSLETDAKRNIQYATANTHILRIVDKHTIQWLESNGNIDFLKQFLTANASAEEDNNLVNEKIVILSGGPGVGKSTMIKKLYLHLQETHWVFAVPLQQTNFKDVDNKLNIHCIAKFILNACDITDDYILHLLSYCLSHQTTLKIYLMFDGFDQIYDPASRKTFIKLVNVLKHSSNANILITTRSYVCNELENGISVPASYFSSEYQEKEIVSYLTKFWDSQLRVFEDVNVQKVQMFAESVVSTVINVFGESMPEFLGIPLHVRIVAEVIKPESSYISPEIIFADIVSLYQRLIEVRCNSYFGRCDFPNNDVLKQFSIIGMYEKLYKLAITQLFNFDTVTFEYKYMEELNKLGVIQSNPYNDLHFSFLHNSVRDYFVAHLINQWLEEKIINSALDMGDFIIKHFLLKQQYKEIRVFLNCYLKNCKISTKILNVCKEKVSSLWKAEQSSLLDNDETFFHICTKENLYFILKHFLVEVVDKTDLQELLCKRNGDLQTALFFAISVINPAVDTDENNALSVLLENINILPPDHIKSIFLSTFLTHFASADHLTVVSKYSINCGHIIKVLKDIQKPFRQINDFFNACNNDRYEDFNKILQQFQNDELSRKYLVQTTNELKETGLHVTQNTQILQKLLKFGADVNFQDHHGMTPLGRAVKLSNTHKATLLIARGADVTIPDFFMNSPLFHAVKRANFDITKKLLNSDKVDVNRPNIFSITALMFACRAGNTRVVRFLLDKGASVNAVDQMKLTALFHCVKTKQIHLIKILKTHKEEQADIDIQDIYGNTPLLYSIKKPEYWDVVNALLDNGANPNIVNNIGEHPLKILIQKRKPRIIEKMFKLCKQDFSIDSIHNLSILDEDERHYIYRHVLRANVAQ